MSLNAKYFIDKFTVIPDDKWITEVYVDLHDETKRCAMGHCSTTEDRCTSTQVSDLMRLINKTTNGHLTVAQVNDGDSFSVTSYVFKHGNNPIALAIQLETPKARVLRVLEIAKEGGL